MSSFISRDRSIIPACDVDFLRFKDIVRETAEIPQVGAYKIGASLALSHGLPLLVETAAKFTDKPIIYDHQKAGTDIPDTGKAFMETLRASRISAVILFPLAGPATQRAWILSAQEAGLAILVGGHMTHDHFIESEGGYISDSAVAKIYTNAASQGIENFVVPGNKPGVIAHLKNMLSEEKVSPVFFAPGFIAQGGRLSDAAAVAGSRWHVIVGRAIYEARDIQNAVRELIINL
jgi:orotidine-5'-phosphate decarboxylase